jgi:hypothetical protein
MHSQERQAQLLQLRHDLEQHAMVLLVDESELPEELVEARSILRFRRKLLNRMRARKLEMAGLLMTRIK